MASVLPTVSGSNRRLPSATQPSPGTRRPRKGGPIVAGLLAAALALSGCAPEGGPSNPGSPASFGIESSAAEAPHDSPQSPTSDEPRDPNPEDPNPEDAESGSALAMLYDLEVKGRAPKTGYDRDLFGWRDDVDRNGCDTRNDVLRRDLHDITLADNGCVVLDGSLTSDFSGETFDFIRGDGNNIDIDHVVALSNAWQTGAQKLSAQERVEFGNDPINLLAVESHLNQQKGDGDAATWLPPDRSYRCEYVARQIAVKHKYDLWVVPPEFDAMEKLLTDCDQEAFGDDPWPEPRGGDTGSSSSGGSGSGSDSGGSDSGDVGSGSSGSGSGGGSGSGSDSDAGAGPGSRPDGAFKNCTEARERGGAPVHAGESGYGRHLDRDGDGVGCE